MNYDMGVFFWKPSAIIIQHYGSFYNNVLSGRGERN